MDSFTKIIYAGTFAQEIIIIMAMCRGSTVNIPSFPSALQVRVSFGLLNNLPPFFSITQ
jgi:hypothetical protein